MMNSIVKVSTLAVCLAFTQAAAAQAGASGGLDASRTASPAIAAPAGAGAASAATHELKATRLSRLEGVNIYDANAKKIGEVEDLVLDPVSGRVLHALVSIGGVMGVGDKHYAVPTRLLRVFSRSAQESVPLKVELGAAPDTLTPAKTLDKDSPYVMGSKLIGTDVDDSGGKEAGEIEDVVIDLQSGEAKFALVEFDAWSVKDKLFAFPMSELKRSKDGKKLALDITRESLENHPAVEKARLDSTDLSAQPWMQAAGADPQSAPRDGSRAADGAGGSGQGSTPAAGGPSR